MHQCRRHALEGGEKNPELNFYAGIYFRKLTRLQFSIIDSDTHEYEKQPVSVSN